MPPATRSADPARVRLDLDAYCHDCQHRHRLGLTPQDFTAELWEWEAKHHGHDVEFLSPRRRLPAGLDERPYERLGEAPWWLTYRENANAKLAYVASTALTITLASLATSSTFLAGQEGPAQDNSSGLYLDHRLTAEITTGTSPTVDSEIRIYGFTALNDTPTYPDQMTGLNAARSVTNAYILDRGFVLLGATAVASTNTITYPIQCLTIAEAFGFADRNWGFYITQNTGSALNGTAANHLVSLKSAYLTIT